MSYDYDENSPDEEQFGRREKRKPRGRQRTSELTADPAAAGSRGRTFDEPGLEALYDLGHLSELIREIKSGKEATVYLARGPSGLLAAKVYRDREVRAFKEDAVYLQGRSYSGKRLNRAIEEGKRQGLSPQLALWALHEYRMLSELHKAGLPVPKPVVEDLFDMVRAGRAVLMEYIGTEDDPAPRLADVQLDEREAAEAWRQSLDILVHLLQLDRVHGDFSTYNLLWWEGRVWLIDMPQMVDRTRNRHARTLLERDVNSLVKSFRTHGVEREPVEVLGEVRARARNPVG